MRSFSELSKSLGRASSTKQSKRATILLDKTPFDSAEAKEPVGDTLIVPNTGDSKPAVTRSADDLFATFDALTRPPSQDISRPFDNIPPPRPSDAKSISKRKNRHSLVPSLPPTVDTLQESLTPFGDAFKSFVQEPQPPATASIKRYPSPSISVIPSLTSNTTLDDASVNTFLSPPESRTVSASTPQPTIESESDTAREAQLSPTPSSPRNRRPSVFKSMLGVIYLKDKVSTYWQPGSSSDSSAGGRDRRSSKPTLPTSPGSSMLSPSDDDKNANGSSLTRGLGSFRRLGRRSREIPPSPTTATAPSSEQNTTAVGVAATSKEGNGVAEKKVEENEVLVPPAPVAVESGRGSPVSMKYSHGVVLHPVPEEDTEVTMA